MIEKKIIQRDDGEKYGYHLDHDYAFMSMDDFAKLVVKLYSDCNYHPIDFTFDESEEDVFSRGEATGWYGVDRINVFDGNYIVIGYYGGGLLETISAEELDYSHVLESLLNLAEYETDNVDPTEFPIAIDAETLPDYSVLEEL